MGVSLGVPWDPLDSLTHGGLTGAGPVPGEGIFPEVQPGIQTTAQRGFSRSYCTAGGQEAADAPPTQQSSLLPRGS